VRVAGDHAFAVVDPHLAAAYPVERCRGRVPEGDRLVERDLLLLAVPIEKAHIDAHHGSCGSGEHRRLVRSREVDPFVDAGPIVARGAWQ
jgi:hypothetical protein